MSNYTITTNFGAKDSLPSGNAGKVIKGSEFTTEFTNIQTAVATKADTAGDTFTGAVTFDAAVTLNSTATITGDLTVDTNTLFVDVSADKVGIGTSSPSYTLDIEADTAQARIHSTVGNSVLRLESVDTGESKIFFADNSASAIGTIEYHHAANYMSFDTVATERMRIDSSGNVGIGTDSPATSLHVNSGTNDLAATLESSDSAVRLSFAESGSTGNNHISLQSNEWYIYSNSTERMRIDSSGHVIIPEGITLGTATGTYVAANTLDDYEEGTWTPAITGSTSGSASYTPSQAHYTKIGNQVYFQCYLQTVRLDTHNIVGDVQISGLPFPAAKFGRVQVGHANLTTADESTNHIAGYTTGSVVSLRKGSTTTPITNSDLNTTSTSLMVSGVYTTNS